MSNIIKVNNPFKRYEREELKNSCVGLSLKEVRLLPEIIDTLPEETDVAIAVNGQIISFEDWDGKKVQPNDFVLVVPRVAKGDDEKSIMNMVMMIAVIWAAPYLAGGAIGGIGFSAAFMEIGTVAIMVGGALLVNSLTPRPKAPSVVFNEEELSQTFGWNPATAQRQGMVRPRFYGLNKMYGNIIGSFTEVTGATTNIQNLYVLMDMGVGPFVEVVIPDTLKINDQPKDNFDAIFTQARQGLVRQNHISYFEKTKVEFSPTILIKNGKPKIYETKNADFDDIEIDLTFPRGLYDATGAPIVNNTVNVTIDIKATSASSWVNLVTEDITDDTVSKVIRSYTTNGVISIIRGNRYQVRVTKNTAERDSAKYGDDLFLERVREVTDEPFTHPRAVLVGLKALATDQLSGTLRFSCYSKALYVVDYRDSSYAIKYSTNPSDVIADILTQPVYSGSYSPWIDLNLMLLLNGDDEATTTLDESTYGHTINFTGTAQLDTAEKKFGSASLLLDGDSDDVNVANDNESFNICENIVDDWTVDFFVKFTDHVSIEYLVTQYEDDANRWFVVHIHGDGLYFRNFVGGVTKIDIVGVGEISDTNWHHIALCKVGANIGLYVDGSQVGYDLMVSGDIDIYDGNLFVGQYGGDEGWFQGHIDHVRIIKRNIFDASPNSTPDDTLVVPTAEYADPGSSFVVERYDGYDPSDLDLPALADLANWCDDVQDNPNKFTVDSITEATNAIIVTRSKHGFTVGDTILFHNIDKNGMVEIVDGTIANVIKITDDTTFTIDLDTSGYTTYEISTKAIYNFEGNNGDKEAFDESIYFNDIASVGFINNAGISTVDKKFGSASLYIPAQTDIVEVTFVENNNLDVVANLIDNWTMSLFVRLTDHTGYDSFIANASDQNNVWSIDHLHGSGLQFRSVQSSLNKIRTTFGGEITDDDWHHIAVCKVGAEIGLYKDGVQVGYDLMTSGDTATFGNKFFLACQYHAPGQWYNPMDGGYLDAIKISKDNIFNASPNSTPNDTITVSTSAPSVVSDFPSVEIYKPRFTFNGGFDIETNMWDAVLRVCELCRCVPYFKGSQISFAIDKAASAVFAYTSGNFTKDSFRQIFIPIRERAREVEVHYRDASQDFQRQPFTLLNPNIANLTARTRLDLFGITDTEMAERIANTILLKNQYIKTIAKLSAGIDSIVCTIGDPILAPIDATKYGQVGDGRITSATNIGNAVITIPGTLTFVDADWDGGSTAYRLMLKTADDVIETKSITGVSEDSAGTETYIEVSGTFATAPIKGDLWAAGEEGYETKKYRVINLRQSEKQRVEITAIEYVDAIYAND